MFKLLFKIFYFYYFRPIFSGLFYFRCHSLGNPFANYYQRMKMFLNKPIVKLYCPFPYLRINYFVIYAKYMNMRNKENNSFSVILCSQDLTRSQDSV